MSSLNFWEASFFISFVIADKHFLLGLYPCALNCSIICEKLTGASANKGMSMA